MKINQLENENVHLCYESSNLSCPKHVYPATIRVSLYILLGATILLTVFGNLLVIFAIAPSKQLHAPTNYLVLSLAVSDLLLGVFVMPPSLIRSLETCWYLGNLLCKIHSSVDLLLSTSSIFMLYFISIDRYCAVSQPLRYHVKITTRLTMSMILTCWVVSAFYGFGMIFLQLNTLTIQNIYQEDFNCKGSCIVLLNKASSVPSALLVFFIPGFFMIGLYLKIFFIAQRHARSLRIALRTEENCDKNRISLSKMEQKSTRTLGIVTGVYLSCWSPFFICILIDPIIGVSIPFLSEILLWIGYVNSGMNPLIYAFLFKWFRESLKKAFRKIYHTTASD